MIRTSNTKKELYFSALSMIVCVTMLIGATFAWFTDTASTGVNSVQAGTLDVQLVDETGTDITGDTLEFVKPIGVTEPVLWEPGVTYNLPAVAVKNNGNLALKYKLVITGINGDAKLNEAIDWTIGGLEVGTEYQLLPNAQSDPLTISGSMSKTAGNEYQGLSIEGIAITVVATQDTVESDSTDNQYDASAPFPVVVTDQEELNDAIAGAAPNTKIILPEGDFALESGSAINKVITISGTHDTEVTVINDAAANDMSYQNGATLTFEGVTILAQSSGNYGGMAHVNKTTFINCVINGKLTLYGDADFIDCTLNRSNDYSIWTWGAHNAQFTNCTFNSGGRALLLYGYGPTNLTVNNCTFNDSGADVPNKTAIEIGNDYNATYNLVINNATVSGFDTNPNGIQTGSTLWSNKNSMGQDKLNVVIDGIDVY